MGSVTVIKPKTGEEISVDESSLPYLEKLGYRTKTANETFEQAREESRESYYSGPVQTAKAFGEGAIRGASFNLIDPDSEQAQGRKEFHPVAEGVGQVAGIVVPSILSGGSGTAGTLARLTPAGKVAQVSERIGGAVAKGRLGQLAVAGTVEGVTERTGALVGAALAGDEVTAEAVQRELGYGALFGFGAGVVGAGVEKVAKRMLSKADDLGRAADDIVAEAPKNPFYDSPEAFSYNKRIKGFVEDQKTALSKVEADADAEFRVWEREYQSARPPKDVLGAKGPHTRNLDAEVAYGDANMRDRALEQLAAEDEFLRPKPAFQTPGGTQILDEGAFRESIEDRLGNLSKGDPDAPLRPFNFYDETPAPGSKTVQIDGAPVPRAHEPLQGGVGMQDNVLVGSQKGQPARFEPRRTMKADAPDFDALDASVPSAPKPYQTQKIERGSNKATQKIERAGTQDLADTQYGGSGINEIADLAGEHASKALDRAAKAQFARQMLEKAPDLSLDAISKLDEKGIAKLAWGFLDPLQKHAPDVVAALRAEMRGALGKVAPKLKDFEALDILEFHKLSQETVEKIAGVHDNAKEVVALWATLKHVDQTLSAKAAKKVAQGAVEAGTEAAQEKLGGGAKVGGFKGWLIKKAGGNLGKKLGAAALGAHVGGPAGFIGGWAVAEAALKGGGGAIGKTVTNAKRAALIATAKGMQKIARGPGRPAAVVRLSSGDRLKRRDDEPNDAQALTAARIDEALYAAGPGRERLADTLSPLRAQSPELAAAIEADAARRAEYLAKYAPKKPGWAAMLPEGAWKYPQDQVERFAAVHEAVNNPQAVLEDFATGMLTPDAAAAFRATSPGLFKIVSQYVMEHFDPKEADYPLRFSVSMLLGVPFDATLMMVPALQQTFAKPEPKGLNLGDAGSNPVPTDAQQAEA